MSLLDGRNDKPYPNIQSRTDFWCPRLVLVLGFVVGPLGFWCPRLVLVLVVGPLGFWCPRLVLVLVVGPLGFWCPRLVLELVFVLRGKSVRSWCDGSLDRSFMEWTHWAISRSSQCSTTGVTKAMVCVILWDMHIKEPLLLIETSSPCGSSGFPLSLSEWSFTICLTPYNCK